MNHGGRRAAHLWVLLGLVSIVSCAEGNRAVSADVEPPLDVAFVTAWNQVAIDAAGLDHTPADEGPTHAFGQHLGPCRSARAMAIVHVAMFEAANAVAGDLPSLLGLPKARRPASLRVAIAYAAHDTLAALYPTQQASFDTALASTLVGEADGQRLSDGTLVGRSAALAVLGLRAADGSGHVEPRIDIEHYCSDAPGRWRQDPIGQQPLALGAQWQRVQPWVLESASQFRCAPPPELDSAAYALAYAEVFALGGDGVVTPTVRTAAQTFVGIFWAYDGSPSLCAPPRLYNQIVQQIALQRGTVAFDLLRLLAITNVALADTGLACWESKWFYDYWRPVCAIRESDPGTGPSGFGDGNTLTTGDPAFRPLGSPSSNTTGPGFTPPFPAYPSGHAAFGGAVFQVLRRFYGTDELPFTFVSDEWNGVTRGSDGIVRPFLPRSFWRLSDAEEENGQSRIYLGIHWRFDKQAGVVQGNEVGDWVFDRLYVSGSSK